MFCILNYLYHCTWLLYLQFIQSIWLICCFIIFNKNQQSILAGYNFVLTVDGHCINCRTSHIHITMHPRLTIFTPLHVIRLLLWLYWPGQIVHLLLSGGIGTGVSPVRERKRSRISVIWTQQRFRQYLHDTRLLSVKQQAWKWVSKWERTQKFYCGA